MAEESVQGLVREGGAEQQPSVGLGREAQILSDKHFKYHNVICSKRTKVISSGPRPGVYRRTVRKRTHQALRQGPHLGESNFLMT